MKNPDTSEKDETTLRCFQCRREIASGNWFARWKRGSAHIAFCSPRCMEFYLEAAGKNDRVETV